MFLAFIRHGQYAQPVDTPSAWLPQPLTAEGEIQAAQGAEALVALIAEHGLTLNPSIDCSRLRRAWETARRIANHLVARCGGDFAVEEFDALAERGVGALANLTVQEIERHIADDPRYEPLPPNWKSQSGFKLPVQGAESLMEAGARVKAHVETRIQGLADTHLKLFVGHGAAFRHAAHLMGMLAFEDIAKLSMFYARPVVYQKQAGGWRLVSGEWKVRTAKDRLD